MVRIPKPKNANIREKRSISIAPTRIDKELLVEVGQILKQECKKDCEVSIELDADSREIETEDSKTFEKVTIPADTYAVTMSIFSYEDYNPVEIEIDIKKPKDSKIRVMGENATWVQGVSDRLIKEFDKKKLAYRYIARYEPVRLLMSIVTSVLLSYVTGFALWLLKIDFSTIILSIAVFFYALTVSIKRFFDWVFRYFELGSEDFKPRKFRKLILAILWGSGIISTILFKLLGLS